MVIKLVLVDSPVVGWASGIDEYGNFSNEGGDAATRVGQRPQSVAIRGSGSGTSGYNYVAGACNNGTTSTSSCLNPAVSSSAYPNPARRYRLTLDSRGRRLSLRLNEIRVLALQR